jgi:hypothetical protein
MSHRSGKHFRRASARDPRLLLVLGVVLVLAALAMSRCEPEDLPGSPLSVGAPWLHGSGGERG